MAVCTGFEPVISSVTGRRPLQAGPTDHLVRGEGSAPSIQPSQGCVFLNTLAKARLAFNVF
jgi:hypothetical protein